MNCFQINFNLRHYGTGAAADYGAEKGGPAAYRAYVAWVGVVLAATGVMEAGACTRPLLSST